MKCNIAVDINKGSMNTNVATYGAKSILNLSESRMNRNTLVTKAVLPNDTKLKNNPNLFNKGASYIFSNSEPTTPYGLDQLGVLKDATVVRQLEASGANLYKGISDNYFKRNKKNLLSNTPSNRINYVIENLDGERLTNTNDRTFLHITSKDIAKARDVVNKEFKDVDGEYLTEAMVAFEEGMEFLVLSGLYRGFDVVVGDAINSNIVSNAVKKYNKHLKPLSNKVNILSSSRIGENIIKVGDPEAFIEQENNSKKNIFKEAKIDTSNLMLNRFTSKSERKTLDRYKKADITSKKFVASKVIDVFKTMIPNLEAEIITTQEISYIYGNMFAQKKGFIIGNKIILNADKFSSSTVFHEFGHYYATWLKRENPEVFTEIMTQVGLKYEGDIPRYTRLYESSGMKFSESDILEEIFVDELGINAAASLESSIESATEGEITETIEQFSQDFLIKLTGNVDVIASNTQFSLNSTVADLFNIGVQYAGDNVSPLVSDLSHERLKQLRDFFITKMSVRDVYNGLASRGLIQFVGNGKMILKDTYGNRYNGKGEIDDSAIISIRPWDSGKNFRYNNKKLDEITGYLDKFKNHASVMFAVKRDPVEVRDIIIDHSSKMKLDTGLGAYVDEMGKQFRRTTEFLSEEFTDNKGTDEYIKTQMYHDARKAFIKKSTEEDSMELQAAATEHALKFMSKPSMNTYKAQYDNIATIFEFKTTEGTFLHTVGEFYFRALNYSNKIAYDSDREGGYMHFENNIVQAITAMNATDFAAHFEKHYFSRLAGQESDVEYKAFRDSFEYMKTAIEGMDRSTINGASSFLKELKKTIIPHISRLEGPIHIMPEVKLSSKTFGVAGTIDLIVLDGAGRAHIFDYKTKEFKDGAKAKWSATSHGRRLKGVMNGYAENAMMKASIQTSVYKLILNEMGIDVAPSKVFYVANKLIDTSSNLKKEQNDPKKMHYSTEAISIEGVQDVTAELLVHFSKQGIKAEHFITDDLATGILDTIFKAAGNYDIDVETNLEEKAKLIYEKAMHKPGQSESDRMANEMYHRFLAGQKGDDGKNPAAKGLKVNLGGSIYVNLSPDVSGDEAIAEIVELLRDGRSVREVASRVENVFNALDRGKNVTESLDGISNDMETGIRAVLADVDSDTHEITKVASNTGFGLRFSDVLMVKNKMTGATRMVILNHDREKPLGFGVGNNNIFGKYTSNNGARILLPTVNWKGTNYNMRLVKAGLMMAIQKSRDPTFNVNLIVSNKYLNDKKNNIPNMYDASTILLVTKTLLEQMKKAGEPMAPEILALLDKPSLFDSKNYIADPIAALGDFLSMATGDLIRTKDMLSGKGKERRAHLKEILANYDARQDSQKLISSLLEFQHSLDIKLSTSEAKLNSDLWTLLDEVIMNIMGLNYTISPKNTTFSNNYVVTTSKMSNQLGSFFNKKIQESTTAIREDFMRYKNEHDGWIRKLADEKGINLDYSGGEALFKASMKEMYKNLWKNDNTERQTAFILKDPSKPGQGLSAIEKGYLTFIGKSMNEFANKSSFQKVKLPPGWVPLIPKSKLSYRSDTNALDRGRDTVKSYHMNRGMKEDSTQGSPESEFTVENRFVSQYPTNETAGTQYSHGRRYALGLTEHMTEESTAAELNDLNRIENNVENIMDAFVASSLDAYHYREVSAFGRSIFYNIKRYERVSRMPFDKILDTITLIQRRVINHQESDANNKPIKAMNKFATNAAIAGTVSQALLEAFTNPMVTAANFVGDKLYGSLFGGTREFSFKSYTRAFGLVSTGDSKVQAVINAIDRTYGISNSDTRALQEMLKLVEGKSIFQSGKLMFVNKLMMETWQKVTMVAYMIEQGSFDAHSIDKDGNLEYDESKDKRFSKEAGKEGKKLYDAVKLQLAKQRGGLTGSDQDKFEDRKLRRAWTSFDSNHVKEIVVELYSSLDDTSKSLSMYYTWMGFAAKMRSWVFSKVSRYFQAPMTAEQNEASARPVRVEDPNAEDGYRIEFQGQSTEGIMYTIQSIYRQLAEHKLDFNKKKSFTEKQKKNMSMLLGDVLTMTTVLAAGAGVFAMAFDDDDEKSEMAQLVYARWQMATGDVFFLKSLLDMTTGNSSMFIGVSIAARGVKSVLNAAMIYPQALVDPDLTTEDILAAQHNMLRSVAGIYKTMELSYQTFGPNDDDSF